MRWRAGWASAAGAALLAVILLVTLRAGQWWWLMIPSAAPGTIAVALSLAALGFSTRRREAPGVALSLAALALSAWWLPVTNDRPAAPTGGESLRVIVWNTHGWDADSDDRLDFLRFLLDRQPDLIILQEAPLEPPVVLDDIRAVWPGWAVENGVDHRQPLRTGGAQPRSGRRVHQRPPGSARPRREAGQRARRDRRRRTAALPAAPRAVRIHSGGRGLQPARARRR